MKSSFRLILLLALPLLPSPWAAHAQSGTPLWQPAAAPAARGAGQPGPAAWFTLDAGQLAARLAAAPAATDPAAAVPLEVPYPDGTLHRFALVQVRTMAPALAARYPQLRAYAGRGLDDAAATVRLETSPAGVQAQVLSAAGAFSVVPEPAAPGRYQSHADAPVDFRCQALELPEAPLRALGGTPPAPPAAYGAQQRTLRLALGATSGYVQNLGGGTVASTLAAMSTLVNHLNAVYERDLALHLELVANNDLLIFPGTDPYNTTDPTALMNANEGVLNSKLPGGAGAYDLGHVLGYLNGGYSGIAYVGVVCSATRAGSGASTGSNANYMATVTTHELGHQLGSNHTFNGDQGNCGGGNRSSGLAYEPGAGNTIMSYDSRCAPDNVGGGIVYFHAASLSAIVPRLTCGVLAATGNRPPSLSVPPSNAYTIPSGTPFALAGTGTDPDGDALAYSWEELDLGNASGLAGAATDATGPPLFRSLAPGPSPARTFPNLTAVLAGTAAVGEILPLVARSLNFRLTARDGRGGVAGANMALAVAATPGPFQVTAPAAALTAAPGSAYTVAWDVQGTDQAPVACANVQILFSADGGQTFPTVLLASTPNDGGAQVTLPRLNTALGRLKIQALNNVFFAVNNAAITLTGPSAPLPVELATFTADARGPAAHLAWITASERDNAGFAVEASADGTAFRRLGWVAGHGSSATPNRYEFDDPALAATPGPTAYYRLRQIDRDGTETTSPVRTVPVPAGLAAQLQLWPNPARGAVTVSGQAPGQLVQVLDLTGRVLLAAPLPASGPLQLTLPGLAPGIYVVRSAGHSRRLVVE